MSKTNVTERMAKVNIEDEHVVQFTEYHKGHIAQLGIDARNCAVLNSARSSTVCGDIWLENYLNSLDHEDRRKLARKHLNLEEEGVSSLKGNTIFQQ